MKARGTMSQQNLVEEVREAAQPRFVASQIMIKKALDTLLEKDYIKRSLTAPDVYEYMTWNVAWNGDMFLCVQYSVFASCFALCKGLYFRFTCREIIFWFVDFCRRRCMHVIAEWRLVWRMGWISVGTEKFVTHARKRTKYWQLVEGPRVCPFCPGNDLKILKLSEFSNFKIFRFSTEIFQ